MRRGCAEKLRSDQQMTEHDSRRKWRWSVYILHLHTYIIVIAWYFSENRVCISFDNIVRQCSVSPWIFLLRVIHFVFIIKCLLHSLTSVKVRANQAAAETKLEMAMKRPPPPSMLLRKQASSPTVRFSSDDSSAARPDLPVPKAVTRLLCPACQFYHYYAIYYLTHALSWRFRLRCCYSTARCWRAVKGKCGRLHIWDLVRGQC